MGGGFRIPDQHIPRFKFPQTNDQPGSNYQGGARMMNDPNTARGAGSNYGYTGSGYIRRTMNQGEPVPALLGGGGANPGGVPGGFGGGLPGVGPGTRGSGMRDGLGSKQPGQTYAPPGPGGRGLDGKTRGGGAGPTGKKQEWDELSGGIPGRPKPRPPSTVDSSGRNVGGGGRYSEPPKGGRIATDNGSYIDYDGDGQITQVDYDYAAYLEQTGGTAPGSPGSDSYNPYGGQYWGDPKGGQSEGGFGSTGSGLNPEGGAPSPDNGTPSPGGDGRPASARAWEPEGGWQEPKGGKLATDVYGALWDYDGDGQITGIDFAFNGLDPSLAEPYDFRTGTGEDSEPWRDKDNPRNPAGGGVAPPSGGVAPEPRDPDSWVQWWMDAMKNTPTLDKKTIENQISAMEGQSRMEESEAMQAMMERGSMGNMSSNQMTGAVGEMQHRGGLDRANQSANMRMTAELENLASKRDYYNKLHQAALMQMQNAANEEERQFHAKQAQQMMELQQKLELEKMEIQQYYADRITPNDAYGAIAGAIWNGGQAVASGGLSGMF